MNVTEVLNTLVGLGNEKRKNNLVKMGIPKEVSFGVSTAAIRDLARQLKKNDTLAKALWDSGMHEAKLLGTLLMTPKLATEDIVIQCMENIYSWDLCDHFCKNYVYKTSLYKAYIMEWVESPKTYYQRAAFTLIANRAVKDKKLQAEEITQYLQAITVYSDTDVEHVYKAISWALREIGKINWDYQEKAVVCAHELLESNNKNKQRIGKLALAELENLVQVEGRSRLLKNTAKMARKI